MNATTAHAYALLAMLASVLQLIFMGQLLADDSKTLVEYGVATGLTIIAQGRPEHVPATPT